MTDTATTDRSEPPRAAPQPSSGPQPEQRPHWLTPAFQQLIASLALSISIASLVYTVWTANRQANDRLVAIGISVLRTDPEKYPQMKTAREWALNLIDANAGGVTFSGEARAALLDKPFPVARGTFIDDPTGDGFEPDPTAEGSATPPSVKAEPQPKPLPRSK